MEKSEKKMITLPLKVMTAFSTMYIISKYGNLDKILPNPLAKTVEKNKIGQFFRNKSSYIFLHSLLAVGLTAFLGSFVGK